MCCDEVGASFDRRLEHEELGDGVVMPGKVRRKSWIYYRMSSVAYRNCLRSWRCKKDRDQTGKSLGFIYVRS